ncbi:MAG: 2-oxo acid dehydrogenase subunit E2, partial [Desulfuromusa sp.]|nr:2-oxo acid dehydrogenase subunit E2 [Desulfuromusa sp.]
MTEFEKLDDVQLRVSPAARKLAAELGIGLDSLQGSGSQGRIVLADIERTQPSLDSDEKKTAYQQKVSLTHPDDRKKSVKVRRLLARKMENAWQTIPHVYVTIRVDMTDVVRFRHDLGVTINDFVLTATVRALVEHPWVNATWNGEQGVELANINIAIAAATDRGLYYPVLHQCEKLNLRQISQQARELVEKTLLPGQLMEKDVNGGTFTITNLGMLGVESFSAIITPPQAAVLSVGAIKGEVVVD